MKTKTNKAISLLQCGDLKAALAIFSTFRIGFTKEEQRTLKIASESLSGNSFSTTNLELTPLRKLKKQVYIDLQISENEIVKQSLSYAYF